MTIQNVSKNLSVVNHAYVAKQALDMLQATSAETYIDDPATRVEYEIHPEQENHLYLQVQIEDPYLRAVTYIRQLNQYSKHTHIKATQLDIKEINPYRYQIHIAYQID